MDSSTWISATVGGTVLGLAAGGLLALTGKTAGVSGILGGVLRREANEWGWKLAFLCGLTVGGWVLSLAHPVAPAAGTLPPLGTLAVGGLLVGVGTSLAGGCTSGHGICGIGRLNRRSILATATFMATGALTVAAVRLLVAP